MNILKTFLSILFFSGTNLSAQTALVLTNGCNADGSTIDSETYLNSFVPSDEAIAIVDQIVAFAGIPANFELRFAKVSNVVATSFGNKRYLLYPTNFLKKFDHPNTKHGAYFQLAHEIGHHLKKHNLTETDAQRIKYNELEADVFAGAVLRMLEISLPEAQTGILNSPLRQKTASRPAKSSRLEAMTLGWKRQHEKVKNYAELYPEKVDQATLVALEKTSGPDWIAMTRASEQKKGLKPISYDPKKSSLRDHYNGRPVEKGVQHSSGGMDSGNHKFKPIEFSGQPNLYAESSKYENMPNFPWPPPNCFQRKTIFKNLATKADDLNDIDERLQRALDAAGYYQRSYYKTPNGFALVTQMEQFAPDGQIKNRFRWADYPVQEDFDGVWDYFKSLIMPEPGRFRVFVFVVTNEVYGKSDQKFDQMKVRGLATSGYSQMPSAYAQSSVTKDHYLEALIYEFEAPQSTKKCTEKCPAYLDIQTHLTQSGLLGIIGF